MIRNLRILFKFLLLIIFLSISVLCLFGCENDNIEIRINEEEHIIWTDIANIDYYTVTIEFPNDEIGVYTTETNELDVFELFNKVGKYKISLSVVGEPRIIKNIKLPKPLTYEIEDKSNCFKYFSQKIDGITGIIALPTEECNVSGKLILPSSYLNVPVISLVDIDYDEKGLYGLYGVKSYFNLDKVTSIYFPDSFVSDEPYLDHFPNVSRIRLSNGLKKIRGHYYNNNSLKELIIPDSVTQIYGNRIYNCSSLERVYIGKNVEKIGGGNFNSCEKLNELKVDEENPYYICDNNYIIKIDKTKKIVCGDLRKQIPSFVDEIGDNAFNKTSFIIPEVIIPSNIKKIGYRAFSNCKGLKRIVFEEGIEVLDSIFYGCDNLEEIVIPSTIKSIDDNFFETLGNLKDITVSNKNDKFKSVDGLLIENGNTLRFSTRSSLFIPNEITILGPYSFYGSRIENVLIPNQITDIGEGAFSNSFIKRITFTNDLNSIGQALCANCDLLEEIDFGEDLTTIHRGMFSNCDNLKEVIIPNNITTIQSNAFERCLNLKKVTFNEGLQAIGREAFYFCYNLENVVLPRSLKTIGDEVFYMTMTSFILYDTIEEIGNYAFFSSTVYTNIRHRSSGVNGGSGATFTDCEIVDGYLYSFHFYGYEEVIDNTHRHYGSLGFGLSGDPSHPDFFSPPRCEIPYREGYKFLGFSYKENSNEIDIYPEEFEYEHDFSTGKYLKKCLVSITGDKSKTLENDTILYAVWEKE